MARRQYTFLQAVEVSATFLFVEFAIKTAEVLTHASFGGLGILPRTQRGLIGIIFAPLLHANVIHLAANAIPLFVLLILLFMDRRYYPQRTLFLIWVASGAGTWLIGRPAIHVGASAVIFGLVTYLIAAGFLMKSWRSAFIAFIVFVFFGGIFYGVLPSAGPVSWEGHLSGAIAGVWAARKNHASD